MIVATAPGRLDVMGGIADYSGSLVLQWPLDRATTVRLEPRDRPLIAVSSQRRTGIARASISLDELRRIDVAGLASRFPVGSTDHWMAYIAGVAHSVLVRNRERVAAMPGGFTLDIESTVPAGKGISSSAALEVAVYGAIAAHCGLSIPPREIATECQWAENHVAGAPCGIMDQMTSACGKANHLLRLRCQPATIEGQVALPEGYRFFGIDSGIRHAVTGADYGSVRTAAFMGYRIIADHAGNDHWGGYLARLAPAEFTSEYEQLLPRAMRGDEFLARHGGIHDTVTSVDPERTYDVRAATAHPVFENDRVSRFADLIATLPAQPGNALAMGRLMLESHASYAACGLGSDGTDALVALALDAGPAKGIYGAKITGGGSGGTVAILATTDAQPAVEEIANRYAKHTGRTPEIFSGSGDGLRVEPSH